MFGGNRQRQQEQSRSVALVDTEKLLLTQQLDTRSCHHKHSLSNKKAGSCGVPADIQALYIWHYSGAFLYQEAVLVMSLLALRC